MYRYGESGVPSRPNEIRDAYAIYIWRAILRGSRSEDTGTGAISAREGNVRGALSGRLIGGGRKPGLGREKEVTLRPSSLREAETERPRDPNLV